MEKGEEDEEGKVSNRILKKTPRWRSMSAVTLPCTGDDGKSWHPFTGKRKNPDGDIFITKTYNLNISEK